MGLTEHDDVVKVFSWMAFWMGQATGQASCKWNRCSVGFLQL